MTLHAPYAATLPANREPAENEVRLALTRRGPPASSEEELGQCLYLLGYGWLRPEGVRARLEELAGQPIEPGATPVEEV